MARQCAAAGFPAAPGSRRRARASLPGVVPSAQRPAVPARPQHPNPAPCPAAPPSPQAWGPGSWWVTAACTQCAAMCCACGRPGCAESRKRGEVWYGPAGQILPAGRGPGPGLRLPRLLLPPPPASREPPVPGRLYRHIYAQALPAPACPPDPCRCGTTSTASAGTASATSSQTRVRPGPPLHSRGHGSLWNSLELLLEFWEFHGLPRNSAYLHKSSMELNGLP